jgi:hypothetical protein
VGRHSRLSSRARVSAPRHWLTLSEAASRLDCSERSVRRYIKQGAVSAIREPTSHGDQFRFRIDPDTLTLRKGAHRTRRAVRRKAIGVPEAGVENLYEPGTAFLYGDSAGETLPRGYSLSVSLENYWATPGP